MKQFILDELSNAKANHNITRFSNAEVEELYNAMKEFNSSYTRESADKIGTILANYRYPLYKLDKLMDAVLDGDQSAL